MPAGAGKFPNSRVGSGFITPPRQLKVTPKCFVQLGCRFFGAFAIVSDCVLQINWSSSGSRQLRCFRDRASVVGGSCGSASFIGVSTSVKSYLVLPDLKASLPDLHLRWFCIGSLADQYVVDIAVPGARHERSQCASQTPWLQLQVSTVAVCPSLGPYTEGSNVHQPRIYMCMCILAFYVLLITTFKLAFNTNSVKSHYSAIGCRTFIE